MSARRLQRPHRSAPPPGMIWKRRFGIFFRLTLLMLPVFLVVGTVFYLIPSWLGLPQISFIKLPDQRPQESIVDPAHLLTVEERQQLTAKLATLSEAMQTDWMLVVVPNLSTNHLRREAKKRFNRWQLGQNGFNQRGALLLVTTHPRQAALILGSDVEHSLYVTATFPKDHVEDYLEGQVLQLYLEKQKLVEGLQVALALIESQFHKATDFEESLRANASLSSSYSSDEQAPMQARLVLPPAE
jgi:uncharacterized membrane protein YgcG